MSGYTPESTKELFNKMCDWSSLRGTISYDEKTESIVWIVADDLRLEISIWGPEGMVHVFDSAQPRLLSLTHWHPEAEEIYEELININEGKTRFAYINTLFGKIMIYIGDTYTKKKHHFRMVHYLGE